MTSVPRLSRTAGLDGEFAPPSDSQRAAWSAGTGAARDHASTRSATMKAE